MKNSSETLRKRNELKRMWKQKIDPKSFPHQIKKICKDCGKLKKCKWNSSFSHKGEPQYIIRCDECYKIYLKKIRHTEKYRLARNKKRKRDLLKRKKWAVDLLGGKCQKCGYKKCLSTLTFHHKNPKEKEFNIGIKLDWKEKTILKELKKCDLLCFNCHMELHEKLNNL